MKINLEEIRNKTVPVNKYMASIGEPFSGKFFERKKGYKLNLEAVNKLKKLVNNVVVVAFSAEWCKDCAANIPVLALVSDVTGLEVRIFGGLKEDPLNPQRKWSIPPSPPEVEAFNVDKIPLILIFNKEGAELGRIVENPRLGLTLEEELLQIILKSA
ncbi:thioredoxin family protein [Candidatus Bathyarchaeota archaeon]|nr:thioredoxin family protein [Candidatus Bathyarchaeota archaeon]